MEFPIIPLQYVPVKCYKDMKIKSTDQNNNCRTHIHLFCFHLRLNNYNCSSGIRPSSSAAAKGLDSCAMLGMVSRRPRTFIVRPFNTQSKWK